jgi:hypothetical protein
VALPLPGEPSRPDYARTPWEVAGYVLAHPRTWVLVVALAVAWRCYGLGDAVRSFAVPSVSAMETAPLLPPTPGATP